MTTRIKLPEPDPGFHPGERVIAARTSRGVELAIAVGPSRIASAVLADGAVTATERAGSIARDGTGSIWSGGTIAPLEGDAIAVPAKLVAPDEVDRHRWIADRDGVLVTAPTGWPALHRVTSAGERWAIGTGDRATGPRVAGFASAGDRVYAALTDGDAGWLAAYDAAGKELWKQTLTGAVGRLALSDDGAQVAVVARAPARCETCLDLWIRSTADGSGVKSIALPAPGDAMPITLDADPLRGRASMGFAHGQVWFHQWSPSYSDDMGGGRVPEKCGYAVYDVATGKARFDTRHCQVHAMIGLADGTVIGVEVAGDRDVTATVTSGPP